MTARKPEKNKRSENKKEKPKDQAPAKSEIQGALEDFFGSIDSLQNVTPWLMSHLLLLQKWHKDKIEEVVPESVDASTDEELFDSKELSIAIPYINMRVRAIGGLNAAFSLVPRSLFTIAVSEYDVFISKLYRALLNLFPDIVDASNKDIKYSDLVALDR